MAYLQFAKKNETQQELKFITKHEIENVVNLELEKVCIQFEEVEGDNILTDNNMNVFKSLGVILKDKIKPEIRPASQTQTPPPAPSSFNPGIGPSASVSSAPPSSTTPAYPTGASGFSYPKGDSNIKYPSAHPPAFGSGYAASGGRIPPPPPTTAPTRSSEPSTVQNSSWSNKFSKWTNKVWGSGK
ncbi:unnamed protein product [Moneuplotes crassus]|uniref:Uncharacterized protein n=1 Tax=Euplotes crassus TaxID=5936 RepID=A0AAD1XYP3_EUPCR|nr:unnamed protein product [Moneuplotes crassus]